MLSRNQGFGKVTEIQLLHDVRTELLPCGFLESVVRSDGVDVGIEEMLPFSERLRLWLVVGGFAGVGVAALSFG